MFDTALSICIVVKLCPLSEPTTKRCQVLMSCGHVCRLQERLLNILEGFASCFWHPNGKNANREGCQGAKQEVSAVRGVSQEDWRCEGDKPVGELVKAISSTPESHNFISCDEVTHETEALSNTVRCRSRLDRLYLACIKLSSQTPRRDIE